MGRRAVPPISFALVIAIACVFPGRRSALANCTVGSTSSLCGDGIPFNNTAVTPQWCGNSVVNFPTALAHDYRNWGLAVFDNNQVAYVSLTWQTAQYIVDTQQTLLSVALLYGGSSTPMYYFTQAGSDAIGAYSPSNGNGSPTLYGNASALELQPYGLAQDSTDRYLYFAEQYGKRLSVFDTQTHVFIVVAGQLGVDGSLDGVGTAAQFSNPIDLAYFSSGGSQTLYIADGSLLRKINLATKNVSTVCCSSGGSAFVDGAFAVASMVFVTRIAVASWGTTLYVVDSEKLRQLDLVSQTLKTIATNFDGHIGDILAGRNNHSELLYIGIPGAIAVLQTRCDLFDCHPFSDSIVAPQGFQMITADSIGTLFGAVPSQASPVVYAINRKTLGVNSAVSTISSSYPSYLNGGTFIDLSTAGPETVLLLSSDPSGNYYVTQFNSGGYATPLPSHSASSPYNCLLQTISPINRIYLGQTTRFRYVSNFNLVSLVGSLTAQTSITDYLSSTLGS